MTLRPAVGTWFDVSQSPIISFNEKLALYPTETFMKYETLSFSFELHNKQFRHRAPVTIPLYARYCSIAETYLHVDTRIRIQDLLPCILQIGRRSSQQHERRIWRDQAAKFDGQILADSTTGTGDHDEGGTIPKRSSSRHFRKFPITNTKMYPNARKTSRTDCRYAAVRLALRWWPLALDLSTNGWAWAWLASPSRCPGLCSELRATRTISLGACTSHACLRLLAEALVSYPVGLFSVWLVYVLWKFYQRNGSATEFGLIWDGSKFFGKCVCKKINHT